MTQTSATKLVPASVVAKALEIPPYAVYRLAESGVLPYQDVTKDWAMQRRRLLFDLDLVRAKYAEFQANKASRRAS